VTRVVLDGNVLVSAVITPAGVPGGIVADWLEGGFDLVVSPRLIGEVERFLESAKFRGGREEALLMITQVRELAILVEDPAEIEPVVTGDVGDDFLVALARSAEASVIVSGDRHLLELSDLRPPAVAPRVFVAILTGHERAGRSRRLPPPAEPAGE
jgi:putative PIN family toxin of toxin-antitoxin system